MINVNIRMGTVKDLLNVLGQVLILTTSWLVSLLPEWINNSLQKLILQLKYQDKPPPNCDSYLSIMDKLMKILKLKKVKDGKKTSELYHIPVYQRQDGATVKLGAFVCRKNDGSSSVFNVKNILVSADLSNVFAVIIPSDCVPNNKDTKDKKDNAETAGAIIEEMTVAVDSVLIVHSKGICADVARNGMEAVAGSANNCPYHIQVITMYIHYTVPNNELRD